MQSEHLCAQFLSLKMREETAIETQDWVPEISREGRGERGPGMGPHRSQRERLWWGGSRVHEESWRGGRRGRRETRRPGRTGPKSRGRVRGGMVGAVEFCQLKGGRCRMRQHRCCFLKCDWIKSSKETEERKQRDDSCKGLCYKEEQTNGPVPGKKCDMK